MKKIKQVEIYKIMNHLNNNSKKRIESLWTPLLVWILLIGFWILVIEAMFK